ncbi:hypothetical protein VTO42DRAFT_704 [Malbranchea cinnamomea]
MQPEALNATTAPRGPLEWGQINFLHTTDTHGWLAGHLKERNYGADWGDFVSFVKHMRRKADHLGVDLLLVDTGDLHDGNGLSDATDPTGLVSRDIFSELDYDLLTIGNHELYVTEVAYGTFANFTVAYGDKYLTSNVEIINKSTGKWQPFGKRYRYFRTKRGLRIMSFGVLFDFEGNTNVTRVTNAKDMVQEPWFKAAVNYREPIDLFVVIGHNPVRTNESSSTWDTVYDAIRRMRPEVPIQIFGGHQHVRDFVVYDEMSTGLASGQYCETVGWLALTGIESPTFKGEMRPRDVPNPTRKARKVQDPVPAGEGDPPECEKRGLRYARRYLDWNRLTFAYHAVRSQDYALDTHHGVTVTHDITTARKDFNLTYVFGCAPQTYCRSCKPFDSDGNIYPLLEKALAKVVVNPERAEVPRLILTNTGSIRFDLVQGPFTVDDAFIVSPFKNTFQYLPDVPYPQASQVLDILNSGPWQKRDIEGLPAAVPRADVCTNPPYTSMQAKREILAPRSVTRRGLDFTELTSGYTTTDDFGSDGDDTPHSPIPYFEYPNDIQANASFPTDGSTPETVDLVFVSFIGADWVVPALQSVGANYTADDIQLYMPEDFLSNHVLPLYAATEWQENMPNCPVGGGIE